VQHPDVATERHSKCNQRRDQVELDIVAEEGVPLRQVAPVVELNKTRVTGVLQTEIRGVVVLATNWRVLRQVSKASNPKQFPEPLGISSLVLLPLWL
jgi:hypothetical protein